jgi:hypothetical protein
MPRISAFRGSWQPNKRPYLTLTPDVYVSIQGETTVVACGECRRTIDVNKYITGVQYDGSVDSPPSSASFTLSIPDTDVNEFYSDGQFVIIPMMEVEIFAKGYYTIGGFPQYYRIFWGLISSVTKNWSNGVTTVSIQCRDILRWWELTNFTTNPAFLDIGKSQSNYNLFGNYFAGMNPYTVIIALAKEAMGDFSITTGSFLSFRPETGPEQKVVASYAKDIMAYWQLKFGNIWNSLVLYGTSGQAYTFSGDSGNVSPLKISQQIFEQEAQSLSLNSETSLFKIQPHEIAAFKVEMARAGDIDFFQNETQSKLSIALTARDQAGGYEFYCDTTGDIVFKPPFYNLNVIPNKPVSWIQDFEIIDESITDSEQEVYTHVTSHGNAFGGTTDWGLNDDITTPRTGVIDWHLLKRYGWRRLDVQVEWAGNAKRLFYHLLDQIDKINSKRIQGTITIPMRPELRMGFPVWIPRFDAFFYVQGISHNFSPGSQATTTLTLTAKRSKFIAPKNIGRITHSKSRSVSSKDPVTKKVEVRSESTYQVDFPSNVGGTSGLTHTGQDADFGGPAVLRDTKTGKLLGFPNAVMVYRQTLNGQVLSRVLEQTGSTKSHNPKTQDKNKPEGPDFSYDQTVRSTFTMLQNEKRMEVIDRLRSRRYEAGMTNAGAYDYAHDVDGVFKELSIIPADSILWGSGTQDPEGAISTSGTDDQTIINKKKFDANSVKITELSNQEKQLLKDTKTAIKDQKHAETEYDIFIKKNPPVNGELSEDAKQRKAIVDRAKAVVKTAQFSLDDIRTQKAALQTSSSAIRKLTSINIMIRPVSDEFGFEVIGHYRYGRGAFIDRGKVQIPNPNEIDQNPKTTVNQLNIQFAAHGGLLTDNPIQDNLGPQSTTFAEAFEKMGPDEYMTGASFKGANYQKSNSFQDVSPTGQQTYTDAINSSVSNSGKAVFAEADAIRRAVSLAEMQPTTNNGLGAVGFNRCQCDLGKTSWLSVLPQTLIRQLLNPVQSINSDPTITDETNLAAADAAASSGISQSSNVSEGDNFTLSGPQGFFEVLRNFLISKFTTEYQENTKREQYAIGGGRTITRPNEGQESNNIIGDPKNTLFDRAALGDPQALQALQGDAQFSFGQTQRSLQNFKDQFKSGGPTDQLGQSIINLPGSIFDAAKGGLVTPGISVSSNSSSPKPIHIKPQFQPPGRSPRIGETINPGFTTD